MSFPTWAVGAGVHLQEAVHQPGHALHSVRHQGRHSSALHLRQDRARLLHNPRLSSAYVSRDEDADIGSEEASQPH